MEKENYRLRSKFGSVTAVKKHHVVRALMLQEWEDVETSSIWPADLSRTCKQMVSHQSQQNRRKRAFSEPITK